MLSVIYAKGSNMLIVAKTPIMLSIVMPNVVMQIVVMLSAVVQSLLLASCYFISNQPKNSLRTNALAYFGTGSLTKRSKGL
jgi:hypothetical protein